MRYKIDDALRILIRNGTVARLKEKWWKDDERCDFESRESRGQIRSGVEEEGARGEIQKWTESIGGGSRTGLSSGAVRKWGGGREGGGEVLSLVEGEGGGRILNWRESGGLRSRIVWGKRTEDGSKI